MNNNRKEQRLGEEQYNSQDCLMRIVEYIDSDNIIIQFQDGYKAKVHTSYRHFKNGNVKNPYHPSVYGVGIIGSKYVCSINKKPIKEYVLWQNILYRCYNETYKNKQPTYKDVKCCNDWLSYEKVYDWIHTQSNYNKWLNGERWAIDKDILFKGNKLYSPETCCLVPQSINNLFTKQDCKRDNLPIGVSKHNNKFRARLNNVLLNKLVVIGDYLTPEEAFYAYKKAKEDLIKQVAQIEYSKGNITKKCYEAMMNYEVEITD